MQLAAALAFQTSNLGSAMKTVEPEPAEASGAENGAEEALLMAIAGTPSLAEAIGRDELLIIVAGLSARPADPAGVDIAFDHWADPSHVRHATLHKRL